MPKPKLWTFYRLSDKFFSTYPNPPFEEFLLKDQRQYTCVTFEFCNREIALPIRSNMHHHHGIKTLPPKGIDFTKLVLLDSPSFIDKDHVVTISTVEYAILKKISHTELHRKFISFLEDYIVALDYIAFCDNNPGNLDPHKLAESQKLVKYSTLQYYSDFINDIREFLKS